MVERLKQSSRYRILVTGSRGKSSLVRLLHCALNYCEIPTYARMTGVVPRELGPGSDRTILRSAGAHVEEMRWWLNQLPDDGSGIVLENSAIAKDLQPLAGQWLRPQIAILSNILPDHQEVWGPNSDCAAITLLAGIPRECPVIVPYQLKNNPLLRKLLDKKGCPILVADTQHCGSVDYQEYNVQLALTALKFVGCAGDIALGGLRTLRPDRFDFHVKYKEGVEFAMAFTANDVASTAGLFQSLKWQEEETLMIFNHRSDRIGRLNSFIDWIEGTRWKDVMVIGDNPGRRVSSARFLKVKDSNSLLKIFKTGDRIFGCGNIAGLPLEMVSDAGW
jgi:gamma-polyglutamate synthase